MGWVYAAELDEVKDKLHVELEGREIGLFRKGDEIYALDDICPHEYSLLTDGEVWDDRVYCAKHGSAFNLKTGKVEGLPATDDAETLEVKIEGSEIFVLLEDII